MKKITLFIAAVLACLFAVGMPLAAQQPADPGYLVLKIAQETVPCTGVGPQDCLQIMRPGSSEWELYYSDIIDFTFVRGLRYTVLVSTVPNEPTPADAPAFYYRLESILAFEPAAVEGDMVFPPMYEGSGEFLVASVGPQTETCQDGFTPPLDCLQVTINGETQLVNPGRLTNFAYTPGTSYTLLLERYDLIAQNLPDAPAVVYQLWQVLDRTPAGA